MAADLIGRELTGTEEELLRLYTALRALAAVPDLPPCAVAGLRAALAHLAVTVGSLALDFEHLLDEGV
ncbi:MAG TPA: hypothetical protein VNB94_01035 [Mycobacteriales bacterium]|nr:hypothetical protein [Mycobacteriales bacterium]